MITIESSLESTLSVSGLSRFLDRARSAVGLHGEVDVLLADDSTLRRLNREFRGKNKPTDVLSFPSPAEIAQTHAGDLAISLDTATRQAKTYGHTLRDEVRILLLHGLLHLSGLDHETDDGEMAEREAELRTVLRLSNTLIERVETPRQSKSRSKGFKTAARQSSGRSMKSSAGRKTLPVSRKVAGKPKGSRAV